MAKKGKTGVVMKKLGELGRAIKVEELKNIIHEIDPYAFITVTEISDVLGTSSKSK